jgi:uncharacterized heparinase superfamily protein
MNDRLMLYFDTVRHLKPVQIYGRAWHRMYRPKIGQRPAPPLRQRLGSWQVPIRRPVSLVGPQSVRFLGEEGDIANADDWNNPAKTKLWLYNLHYFDDLMAQRNGMREAWQRVLLDRWIRENPPGGGNGWESYPLSLRIANWIKWSLGGVPMERRWIQSLATQLRWLERRLEWHLLGNHLLANAKALLMGGLFFEGREARRWIDLAAAIFDRQLGEQILADGGHFERSPMYHAIILEDFLDILNACSAFGFDTLPVACSLNRAVPEMLHWLDAMTHPDGDISFFNDAALGIAPDLGSLRKYAGRIGICCLPLAAAGMRNLASSGYVRLDRGDCALIADLAPVGPDHLPGHAHADTLSFELSIGAERLIVNGGTSVYGNSAQRRFERSTPAHSTVTVDGADSSQIWSGFRVARRARVHDIAVRESSDSALVSASHDGFCRLPGSPKHFRSWNLTDRTLTVIDRVECQDGRAVALFHLGPGIDTNIADDAQHGTFRLPSGRTIEWETSARASLQASQYHPEFGTSVAVSVLVVGLSRGCLTTRFHW